MGLGFSRSVPALRGTVFWDGVVTKRPMVLVQSGAKKRRRKWQRFLTPSPHHSVTGELDVHMGVALHERRERPFRLGQNL
jgi:hypothetical protein